MSDLSMGWTMSRTVGERVLTIVREDLTPPPRTIVQNIENAHGGFNQEDSLIFFAGPRSGFRITVAEAGRTYVGELTDAAIAAACGRTPCEFARRMVAPPTAMVTTLHAARETLDCILVEWLIPFATRSELMAIRLYENAPAAIESRIIATVSAPDIAARLPAKIESRPSLAIPVSSTMVTPLNSVNAQESHPETPIGWTHTRRCDPGTLTVVRGTDCWRCDNGVTHICARQGSPVSGFRIALAVTEVSDIQTYVGFMSDARIALIPTDNTFTPDDFMSRVRRIPPIVDRYKWLGKHNSTELKWAFCTDSPAITKHQPLIEFSFMVFDEADANAPSAFIEVRRSE